MGREHRDRRRSGHGSGCAVPQSRPSCEYAARDLSGSRRRCRPSSELRRQHDRVVRQPLGQRVSDRRGVFGSERRRQFLFPRRRLGRGHDFGHGQESRHDVHHRHGAYRRVFPPGCSRYLRSDGFGRRVAGADLRFRGRRGDAKRQSRLRRAPRRPVARLVRAQRLARPGFRPGCGRARASSPLHPSRQR